MTDVLPPDQRLRPGGPVTDGAPVVGPHHVLSVLLGGLLLAAPLLLVVVPLADEAGLRGDPLAIALSSAILVYSALRLTSFCWRARPRWAEALFWAFSYVWLGLASFAQILAGTNPLSTTLAPGTRSVALGAVLLGFLAFDVGRRLPARLPARSRDDDDGRRRRWVLAPRRVIIAGAATVALTPVLVVALGGTDTLLDSRQAIADHLQRGALYTEGSQALGGLLLAAANVAPFATALALLCLLRARVVEDRRLLLVGLLGALVVANVLLNNPISNARSWFLTVAIAVVLTVGVLRRPVAKIAFLAVFLASATVVFPYADAFRGEQTGIHHSLRSTSMPVDYLVGKTDYGAVTDVGVAVLHVERHGHTWGEQLLGAATFWVPRALWADKPVNSATILADEIQFPNRNLDTPLWAEGYLDFGLLGTVVLLAVFGVLVRRADDALEHAELDPRRHADALFPIAATFVGYESLLLRGSLLQAMARIVTVVAVFLLLSRRSRPDEEPIGLRGAT